MPALWAARPARLRLPTPIPRAGVAALRTGHGLPVWSRQTREPAPAPRHRPPTEPRRTPAMGLQRCRPGAGPTAPAADFGAHVGPGVGGRSYSSVSNICSGQGPSYHFGYVIFAKSGAVLPHQRCQDRRSGPCPIHPKGSPPRRGNRANWRRDLLAPIVAATQSVAARIVVVAGLHEPAATFYEHCGSGPVPAPPFASSRKSATWPQPSSHEHASPAEAPRRGSLATQPKVIAAPHDNPICVVCPSPYKDDRPLLECGSTMSGVAHSSEAGKQMRGAGQEVPGRKACLRAPAGLPERADGLPPGHHDLSAQRDGLAVTGICRTRLRRWMQRH